MQHSKGIEANMRTSHAHTLNHGSTPTYNSWANMIQRCTNPHHPNYAYYGGRGITVCERWLLFGGFLADMGIKPSGMSIERKDNNGNYEPANCCWATGKEQSRNRRNNKPITHEGVTKTFAQWAEDAGIGFYTLRDRMRRGWPFAIAISTPTLSPSQYSRAANARAGRP